ncbi:DUF5977 domain-containing protein [Chryseobacterium phocaeense]|uniref:DUF5977 domain-containing protein n=1 Tax=Chryseobacterium phocaeense TaxID=1816690 RepID=UPI00111A0F47|nr:DUF5977 domain-containing protein [Chryseobacterium phocaeense]
MMKRKITFITTLILSFVKLYAQADKNRAYYFNDFPKTPSTQTFQRYGEIQNSEYIGANSPSIPLYNVEEGDINIPLNLNYISGNGIKVRDEASHVGLGWGIPMATITQYVSGGFDDFSEYNKLKLDFLYDSTPPFTRNNFEACENSAIPSQYLNQLGYDKYTYYKSMKAMLPIGGYFKNYNHGLTEYDTAPDIFICNLFGEKIEFITKNFKTNLYPNLSFAPTFESINKRGYKIEYNTSDLFIITSPAGIRYYFSKAEEFGVASINSNGTTTMSNVQGRNYVVTKIIDKNNRTVTINYKESLEPGSIPAYAQHMNLSLASNYYTHNDSLFPANTYYSGACKPTNGYGGEYNGSFNGPNYSSVPYLTSQTVGEYLIPVGFHLGYYTKNVLLVQDISGDFGTVSFEYSEREDWSKNSKLDKIVVKNNIAQIAQKIDFNYSYFTAQNTKTVRSEAGNLNIPATAFPITDVNRFNKRLKLNAIVINDVDHYSFKYNAVLLPEKDSFAVDYWGYFNGNLENKTLFPNPLDFNFTLNGGTNVPLNDKNNNERKANLEFAKAGILEKITYPTTGYAKFDYELNSADNLFVNEYPSAITNGNGIRLKKQINYDSNDNILTQTIFEYEGGKSHNPLDLFKKTTTRLISGVNGSYNSFTTYNFTTLSLLAVSDNTSSPLSAGNMVAYSSVTKKEVDNNNTSKGKTVTYYYNNPETEYQFKDDKVPVYFPKIKSKDNPENGLVNRIKLFDSNDTLVREIENEYSNSLSSLFYGSSLNIYYSTAYTNACVIASSCNNNGVYQPDLVDNPVTAFSFYPVFSKQSLLKKTQTKDYLNNKLLLTKVDYIYNNYNLLWKTETLTPDSDLISESAGQSSSMSRFLQANILSDNTGTSMFKNGVQILNRSIKFDNLTHFNPTSVTTYNLNDPNINTPVDGTFDKYNSKGKILQYTTKEGSPVTVIWGYKQTHPIAKIEGGTYSQVMQAFGLDTNDNNSYLQLNIVKKSDLDTDESTESSLIAELDNFRKRVEFKDFKITVYTYDPLIGVKTITSPSGFREFYKYDASNRLIRVLDKEGNILKDNKYNFTPTKHYSSIKSGTFTRNNCGPNAIGGNYTYIVPEGQYTSIINQDDANQQAQNDVNSNGQAAANLYGTCTTMNCSVTKGSGINQFHYGSIFLNNTNEFRVQMGFRYFSNLPWSTGVVVGKISGNCIPSGQRSSSTFANGVWLLTIDPNGNITAKISSASPSLVNDMNMVFDFTFSIN